jgi:hypothetical protein
VICERDIARARERDAKLLADCGGVVKDTPRQDILPNLEAGFLSAHANAARGTLFPQPKLMDTERSILIGLPQPVRITRVTFTLEVALQADLLPMAHWV